MSNNKKEYFNFGVGWKYSSQAGNDYFSCKAYDKADPKWNRVRIQAVNDAGETAFIDEFVVFYNKDGGELGESGKPKPDIRFSFSIDQD